MFQLTEGVPPKVEEIVNVFPFKTPPEFGGKSPLTTIVPSSPETFQIIGSKVSL